MTTASEHFITEAKQETGRECGTCSLCCKLLDVPEVNKPIHDWCQHARPGRGGCSIYATRPQVCRGYGCAWLLNPALDDRWFPQRAHLVMDSDLLKEDGRIVIRVHLDPAHPNRWREEPYYSVIKNIALRGLRGDRGFQHFTILSLRGEWRIVLPHKEVPYAPGIALPLPNDNFEFIACKSAEDVKALDGKLHMMVSIGQRLRKANPTASMAELLVATAAELKKLMP